MVDFKEMYGTYAYGKIRQVPNRKNSIQEYTIEYGRDNILGNRSEFDNLCTVILGTAPAKLLLRRGVERANLIDYRYNVTREITRRTRTKRKRIFSVVTNLVTTTTGGYIFLGDILNETVEKMKKINW